MVVPLRVVVMYNFVACWSSQTVYWDGTFDEYSVLLYEGVYIGSGGVYCAVRY